MCLRRRGVFKRKKGSEVLQNVDSGNRCAKLIIPTPPPNFKGLFKHIRQEKVKTFYNKLHSPLNLSRT